MIDTSLATLVEIVSQPSRNAEDAFSVFPLKCKRFEGLIAARTYLPRIAIERLRAMNCSYNRTVSGKDVPHIVFPLDHTGVSTESSMQHIVRMNVLRIL